MRKKREPTRHQIAVELNGTSILAWYYVERGFVTVETDTGTKSAALHPLGPDHLARMLVRELAQERRA